MNGMGAKVSVVLPTLQMYIQEVISVKFKDCEAQILDEVNQQFEAFDLNQIVKSTVSSELRRILHDMLISCIRDAMYHENAKGLKSSLTNAIAHHLGAVGTHQEGNKCQSCGKYQ